MLFNLSERVFYSLADLGGRSSYAETEAPEASIHAEAPAEDMTGVNPYEGVDWGLPTAGGGFGCILEPGYYTIGQQIPEGVYTITPDDGSSLTMTHDDEAHDRWYQTTMLSCPEGGEPELVLPSWTPRLNPRETRRASLSSCAPGEMTFKPTLWGRRSRRVCMT